jgi:hypothetical protein
MRWSEAGYLSQIMLTHALRQASVSLILGVRQNKTMDTKVYIVRWRDGTFSIQIGAGPNGILDDIDSISDPRLCEIRVLPMDRREGWLVFDQQKAGGDFRLEVGESTDYEKDLWGKCGKVIWPKPDYPLNDHLKRVFALPISGQKDARE